MLTFSEPCQIELHDLGVIRVMGKDAARFLQAQLTCDLTQVTAEQNRLGAHCDALGRVQATFRLFFYQNEYYFLLHQGIIPHLLSCLRTYAVLSDVQFTEVSQDWNITGVAGQSMESVLRAWNVLPPVGHTAIASEGIVSLSIIPSCVPRFVLLVPKTHTALPMRDVSRHLAMNDWYLLDILSGITTIFPENRSQFTPHQLNYPALGGVSFNKGCYIGQEIIARTQYLGYSKRGLYRLTYQSNQDLPSGLSIQDRTGSSQGTMLMVAREQDQQYQALACLQTRAVSHSIWLGDPQGPALEVVHKF